MIYADPADYMSRYEKNPSPWIQRTANLLRDWLLRISGLTDQT